ncbi:uncharacterized protein BYT42DRAFT_160440 [Radiomyces spectabilis]|uniref:uncharacterized protein n=1 Tax=Radiomyces spectabilis TaxID=64574 RepID=UPI0022208620|nr:uncharacterized protein BYT42DRAFT_160440 [Radiomyces spectabilis]KAI8365334.1 hypothetical protein BYT42DRAFT_160440 [Radiomyces spectabilis]
MKKKIDPGSRNCWFILQFPFQKVSASRLPSTPFHSVHKVNKAIAIFGGNGNLDGLFVVDNKIAYSSFFCKTKIMRNEASKQANGDFSFLGVLQVSSFDPHLQQYQTRTLCLPQVPVLESLEHLFTTTSSTTTTTTTNVKTRPFVSRSGSSRFSMLQGSRFTEVFVDTSRHSMGPASSVRLKKCTRWSIRRAPRRCVSHPTLKPVSPSVSINTHHASQCRTAPKRTLSNAFQAFAGLIQRANKKKRSSPNQSWPTETWLDEISSTHGKPLVETKRAENWWATTPALIPTACH